MTICIATICDSPSDEKIVFATDHMVTTNSGQFEHSIEKYRKINDSVFAMLSGQALLFDDLIKLDGKKKDLSFDQIKQQICENFKKKRWDIIQNQVLNKFDVNKTFVKESLEKAIPNPITGQILEQIANFSMQTEILLVGFDDSKARISVINESDDLNLRSINFHAIGSGQSQAINTLLFQRHSKKDNLKTTIYNVYKAKRTAEVMNGVGKETDMFILTNKTIYKIDDVDMVLLGKIYEEELSMGKCHKNLDKLKLVN